MKFQIFCFLIALVAAPLHAEDKSPETFTAGHSFSFTIPAGFTSVKQATNTYPIFVNSPANYTAYLQVATDAYQGDLLQFAQSELRTFQTTLANVAFPATGRFTTKTGVKGVRALMTFTSANGPMEMAAYYFQKPGEVEALHGFCLAPTAAQTIPLFDASANTIVLLK